MFTIHIRKYFFNVFLVVFIFTFNIHTHFWFYICFVDSVWYRSQDSCCPWKWIKERHLDWISEPISDKRCSWVLCSYWTSCGVY